MDAIEQLKLLVIQQYEAYLKQMSVGKYPDYSNIMDKIVFIDTYEQLNNKYRILDKLLLT